MAANLDNLDLTVEPGSTQSRSFGGCETCRSRRVKCDESRPTCGQCRKSAIYCGGYSKAIFFDFESNSNHEERTRFRRPLFSEKARRQMSEQLTSSIPSALLLWHISQLDEECQRLPPDDEIEVCRGPFGAFNLLRRTSDPPVHPPPSARHDEEGLPGILVEVSEQARDTHLVPQAETFPCSSLDAFVPCMFDMPEPNLLPDFVNIIDSSTLGSDEAEHENPESIISVSVHQKEANTSHSDQIPQYELFSDLSFSPPTIHAISTTYISSSIPTAIQGTPKNAVFLLQHFSTAILSFLTPVRHEKTPWHVLFLPNVRNCMALLALGQPVDHAGMCAFHGMLAISARSLGSIHQSQMWLDEGESHKKKAAEHCEIMLQAAYDLPKRYKYKSVLMALQTMILISTLGGDPVTEEYYFLEAEKFIKLNGLGRKHSRKVRLLHQYYAYERLMYESTCMRGIDFKHRHRVCNDIASISVVPYPEDSMAYRPPNWQNLDEEMSKPRSPDSETEHEDEVLGIWPDALYSKASGLPEQWIQLVLHVVLLGKEKDAAEQSSSSSGAISDLQQFLERAKTLDRCINQHIAQATQASHRTAENCPPEQQALDNVLDAIRHSLQIYFYRRIYDVNSSWLQEKVVKVRDCLLRCETVDPGSELSGCVGLLWASFVASCEAEDMHVQNSFAGWYNRAARRTGMTCWMNSLYLSEQLWNERRKSKGSKLTWIDILKRQHSQRQQHRAFAAAA
ncbi:unnamed protein product [Clonostachys rosea]|uniref:Zn(2)-C6 fungal-type domain-containing protein n=1 Tax=Bionectria ochroleuca TaxID=29856 RepID=A0ABY6UEK6_BIOOC|nr:unnamed protein product [Clonostachys rosea]